MSPEDPIGIIELGNININANLFCFILHKYIFKIELFNIIYHQIHNMIIVFSILYLILFRLFQIQRRELR